MGDTPVTEEVVKRLFFEAVRLYNEGVEGKAAAGAGAGAS